MNTYSSLDLFPIPSFTPDAQLLAPEIRGDPTGEENEHKHGPGDEGVLSSSRSPPWSYCVSEAEGHRAAHDVQRGHCASRKLLVAIDDIPNHDSTAGRQGETCNIENISDRVS